MVFYDIFYKIVVFSKEGESIMKKNLIALMILAITSTALISCGKKDDSSKNESNKPVVSEENTSADDNKENSTGVDGEEVVTDENT